jgi:hypothetical protein
MKNSLILLVLTMLLAACGPSQEEIDATGTQIAANIFATQTAVAPTHTPTPTPTNTPTLTPTPTDTPTPTATPVPTDTPSPSPTNTPPAESTQSASSNINAESIILTSADLGPEFLEIPAETMGLTEESLTFGDTQFDGFFVFADNNFNIYMGLTKVFETSGDQVGYDVLISNPELMASVFAASFTAQSAGSFEATPLEGVDDIGDASGGVTGEAAIQGAPAAMEIIIFRRDEVGAMIMTISLSGSDLLMSTSDIARLLDAKIAKNSDE